MSIQANKTIDAKGLSCPMPIVKTRDAVKKLKPGEVLEVLATDRGSIADIEAWADSSGHQYIGTNEIDDVLKHYIRKATESEEKNVIKFPHTIQNETLANKIQSKESMTIIDVREPAEYKFGHIPGAISIPFGELKNKLGELNKKDPIYVICRTGNRSDYACKQLEKAGFKQVKNAVQGMIEWTEPLKKE